MKFRSRRLWLGALLLIVLSSSCNLPAQTPPAAQGTILPPSPIATDTLLPTTIAEVAATVAIPVTGMESVTLQCQFCVNDETHALLIMPERASFLVSDPVIGVNCLTAKVVNSQRIVLCRGAKQTTFTFNVCIDNSNCIQLPITLQDCPLGQQPNIGKPAVTSIPFTQLAPPAVNTQIPSLLPTNTSVPAPTQVVVAPPAATLVGNPPFVQPTRGTHALPPQTGSGIQDPAEFVRWYFASVWQVGNYQDLWDNYLTSAFKNRISSGGYADYVQWWTSVQRVDVTSVDVLRNDGAHAWVRVNVTFTMKDGRVISNQQYDYSLLYDAARQTWMFDYPTT
jgi:hypothetical protein